MTRSSLWLFLLVSISLAQDNVQVQLFNLNPSSGPIRLVPSFSYEWYAVQTMFGTAQHIKQSAVQLLLNFGEFSGVSPSLRIGGNSADTSWYNPDPNIPNPNRITYSIVPEDLIVLNKIADASGSKLILDLNFLRGDDATWTLNHISAINSTIGWKNVDAIEIGNEPDLFFQNGNRAPDYNYQQFQNEFEFYLQEIKNQGLVPRDDFVQCATFCCVDNFVRNFDEFSDNEAQYCKRYSLHPYPLNVCAGQVIPLDLLLQDEFGPLKAKSFREKADHVITRLGKRFVIGETNSVACHGSPGTSDVFGAALWGIDWLFNFADIGTSGLYFHGGIGEANARNMYYTPLYYENPGAQVPEVRPIYYGMYFFSQAVRAHSVFVNGNITTTEPLIKVWTLLDTDSKAIRVVVIHKNIHSAGKATVTVSLSGDILLGYNLQAKLIALKAPGPFAKVGISLGGQTFDGTIDGRPLGVPAPITVVGDNAGRFKFQIDPASAAYLEIMPIDLGTSGGTSQTTPGVSTHKTGFSSGKTRGDSTHKTGGATTPIKEQLNETQTISTRNFDPTLDTPSSSENLTPLHPNAGYRKSITVLWALLIFILWVW